MMKTLWKIKSKYDLKLIESGFIEEEEEEDEGGAAGGPTDEKVELRSPTFQISRSSKAGKHRTVGLALAPVCWR